MPRIACILPVYNVAPYLGAAMASLLAQTERDFSLLVIDDGSSDDTLAVAERFASDRRVTILRNEQNMGVAATANRGILATDSEYIARMDGDDSALPRRFERQREYMDQHQRIGLCGTRRIDSYANGKTKRGRLHTDSNAIKAALFWDMVISQPTFFFRRAALVASGQLYDPACPAAEDYELLCRLRPHLTFGCVAEPLLRYTVRADSLSHAANSPAAAMIDRIRARNLEELLGSAATPADHALNRQLRQGAEPPEPQALADFLTRLVAANTARRLYPPAAFAGVLGEKLLRLIKRQQAAALVPVYRAFCRAAGVPVSPVTQARLLWLGRNSQ